MTENEILELGRLGFQFRDGAFCRTLWGVSPYRKISVSAIEGGCILVTVDSPNGAGPINTVVERNAMFDFLNCFKLWKK